MYRTLLLLAAAMAVAVAVAVPAAFAAGSTQVEHFSDTHPTNVCGISGTVAVHGTTVFRDTGDGTFFKSGTFFGVFTADNGKSTTLSFAGPTKPSSPPVIDEQAGTVTIMTTSSGLYAKFSITRGPTLILDAGTFTFVDVYEYTENPNDPVGAFISETLAGLHGPHPDLLSDFSASCDLLVPYLQDP